MAVDGELRNLVAQTLETRGVLGKIRAELRASVFLALDEQGTFDSPLENKALKSFMSSENGVLVVELVQEFLDFFHLDYTKSVFEPELGLAKSPVDRSALARKLSLGRVPIVGKEPLLAQLVRSPSSSPASVATTAQQAGFPTVGAASTGAFATSSRLSLADSIGSRTSPTTTAEQEVRHSAHALTPSSSSSSSPISPSGCGGVHSSLTTGFTSLLSPFTTTTTATTGIVSSSACTTPSAVPISNPSLRFGTDTQAASDSMDGKLKLSSASGSGGGGGGTAISDHSASELSMSVNSHSRSLTGSLHDASKKSTLGSISQHRYSDDDFHSGQSQISSILSDVPAQGDLLAGSGSDSSWLSRPVDHPSINLDTSDHSVSQMSDGEFSYAEDVQN